MVFQTFCDDFKKTEIEQLKQWFTANVTMQHMNINMNIRYIEDAVFGYVQVTLTFTLDTPNLRIWQFMLLLFCFFFGGGRIRNFGGASEM